MKDDQKARPSLQDARDAIRVLFEPDQVVELRALGSRYTTSGYYNDHELLAADTIRLASNTEYHGVYWTLQRLNPALLARSPNRYRERVRETTSDPEVSAFRWVLIDLDPVRPAGISASDDEKAAANAVLEWLLTFFRVQGIEPLVADSGNGYHVLLHVDLAAADAPLVKRFLEALAARFDTDGVKIDRKVFNPGRISKGYGTVARKGTDVADRPHRAARLLCVPPAPLPIVPRTFLEELAAEVPEKKKEKKRAEPLNLEERAATMEEFLSEGGVGHGPRRDYNGGFKWQLDACPFNSAHTTSIVTITSEGALGFGCPHNSCSDKHWAEFRAHVEEELGRKFIFNKSEALSLVSIEVGPNHLAEMIGKSEQVLHGIGLKYFERNSEFVHTVYGRDLPDINGINRAKESVVIKEASYPTIIRDLDARASYFKLSKRGEPQQVVVPPNLPGQIHDRVRSEVRAVPYPTLDMVTASPVLLPSGSVSQDYYAEGVLFAPNDPGRYAAVPDHPTKEDAQEAMRQFHDIFNKFPFVDPHRTLPRNKTASYSVVLAKVLSLIARPYTGPVPLFGFNAPTRRAGKTRADEAATAAALGYKPTTVHFVNEEEFGKHLQPLMRAGDRAIQIDNVEGVLRSSKANILLTGGVLRDRVLGESRDVVLVNNAVFSATGNNLVIGGDLTARAVRCDIDPEMENPESRSFDFDPVDRAIERHPQLVIAALIALSAFLLAGAPWTTKRAQWGGFERWDHLVCGCLIWLGYADPYESRNRVLESDPVRESNVDLLEEWYARYKDRPVSLRQIRKDGGEVREALMKDGKWDGYTARWILRRMEGRVCGSYRLIRLEGQSRYRVEKSGTQVSLPGIQDSGPEPF